MPGSHPQIIAEKRDMDLLGRTDPPAFRCSSTAMSSGGGSLPLLTPPYERRRRRSARMPRGNMLKEVKVAREPDALVEFFETLDFAVKRVGWTLGRCPNGCMRGWPITGRYL